MHCVHNDLESKFPSLEYFTHWSNVISFGMSVESPLFFLAQLCNIFADSFLIFREKSDSFSLLPFAFSHFVNNSMNLWITSCRLKQKKKIGVKGWHISCRAPTETFSCFSCFLRCCPVFLFLSCFWRFLDKFLFFRSFWTNSWLHWSFKICSVCQSV